jgi:tetratricopeptide (TPR) repeat protein
MLRVSAASRPEGTEARESLLKQSAAADPTQREIWGELGSAQLAAGEYSQAQESLKEALRRQPREPETLRLEALFAAMEQRWPDAQGRLSALGARSPAELQRVLAVWPQFLIPGPEVAGKVWDCLRGGAAGCPLASAEPNRGESAKDLYAEGRWEQLVALPPSAEADSADALWRGVAFARTGNCSRAIPLLERGLKADEQAAGFRLQLCYAGEGDRVVSRLRIKGDEAALHQLKGDMVLRLHNDAATAELEYAEALKSRPKDPHLLARLADAYKQLGDGANAREAAQAAVAVDSRESSALHTLAEMAMNERDYDEAIARLKQLLALDPDDEWTEVQLGVAYGQMGNPEEALRYLGPRLAAGYPDPKGALHAMLARALRKLGREDEAKQAANEAARLANLSLENNGNGSKDVPQ